MASLFFLGLLLLLAVYLLVNLRHERLGRLQLSRRKRIAGFSALTVLYLATLYGWLFWQTFYDLRAGAGRLELTLLMPERRLAWQLEEIESIRRIPGSRAGFSRLQVETRDGRRFRSPDRRAAEIEAALARLPQP